MRIAIVGSGIAGMVVARLAHPEHEITVFEAGDWVGGHAHTVELETDDGVQALDTGFLVYNRDGYPEFCRLLEELEVPTQASDMSFSVRCERTGLEYNGTSLNSLFAQRRNILRPSFHRMVRDILRFYREAPALANVEGPGPSLGDYLEANDYSRGFVEQHVLPMGAAIWSAPSSGMRAFPAKSFVRFFQQHGLMQVRDRPRWRTITGGSREYVRRLTAPFADRIRLGSPVREVRRSGDFVELSTSDGGVERFDHVFLALHADQALQLLADPREAEREVLSCFPYQENDVVLHRDERLLPKRQLAHASWNYHLVDAESGRAAVTYHLNKLQGLRADAPFLVTLNRSEVIRPETVLGRYTYDHPSYSAAAFAAQRRHAEVSGAGRTHYCGAYWGHGFHEDGVVSALRAWERFLEGRAT